MNSLKTAHFLLLKTNSYKEFLFVIFTFFISALFEISTIAFVFSYIYSIISNGQKSNSFFENLHLLLPAYENNSSFILFSILIFVIFSGVIRSYSIYLTQSFAANIGIKSSKSVYRNATSDNNIKFNENEDAKVKSIILAKINQVISGVFINLLQLISSSIVSALIIIILILETKILFIYFALIIIFFYAFIYFSSKKLIKKFGYRFVKASNNLSEVLDDTLKLKQEINIYNVQDIFSNEVQKYDSRMRLALANSQFIATFPRYLIETISLGTILFLLIINAKSQESNDLSYISSIAAIGIFGLKLIPSIQIIYSSLTLIQTSTPALSELFHTITFRENKFGILKKKPIPKSAKINSLIIKNLSHKYKNSKSKTFDNLSCIFSYGQSTAIVGPSGAGKTTLLKIILGQEMFSKGEIYITCSNNKTYELKKREIKDRISLVPQKTALLTSSIKDNIYFARKHLITKESLSHIFQMSKILNLEDLFKSLPNGIDTVYRKEVDNLSGGQIQKIAILRALISKPEILILDEPTSAMDRDSMIQFSSLLKSLSKFLIVITITHNVELSKYHDKVIKLK